VYHDESDSVTATSKCENCNAPVCLEHMQKYRITRMDEADTVYEYCIDCHQQATQHSYEMGSKLLENFGPGMLNMRKMFIGFFAVFIIIALFIILIPLLFGFNSVFP
jgi:hypothetical protein